MSRNEGSILRKKGGKNGRKEWRKHFKEGRKVKKGAHVCLRKEVQERRKWSEGRK